MTQESLEAGIAAATVGNHIGDIGAAVQAVVEAAGFSVVRDLVGHGIGVEFHEEPQVPNYGKPKRREKLVPGLTMAIEPMVNIGGPATKTLADRWTIVTLDGSLSAHFEHTVAITENGPTWCCTRRSLARMTSQRDRPFWRVVPEAKLSGRQARSCRFRAAASTHVRPAPPFAFPTLFGGLDVNAETPLLACRQRCAAAARVRGRHGECTG